MNTGFRLFPEQLSENASATDALYYTVIGIAAFFTVLICALIVLFITRYHYSRRVNRKIRATHGEFLTLEIAWSVIPLAIVMFIFAWGAARYLAWSQPPPDVLDVYVVGKQWMWKIQHESGRREIDTLHVPAGTPVRLNMISEDVIHSFFLPAFRTKRDVLPGKYSTTWFDPTIPGESHLFCTEYCGTSHSDMVGKVVVMEPSEYAAWAGETQEQSLAERGYHLFEAYRCGGCHGVAGEVRAPSLEGVYGSSVPLQNGETVVADDAYIRESILNPSAKIVAGFATTDGRSLMPSFEGQISESDVFELIAYIRSLSREQSSGTEQ